MIQKKFKLLLFSLIILLASYTFMGGDCSTDNNNSDIPSPTSVDAPGSLSFKVEAEAGGDSKVTFSWTASPDENVSDFKGYRIITVELDSDDNPSTFQEQALDKAIKTHAINPLQRGKRFKTFVLAELNNGTKSDSLETEIYAGIYYNIDGVIDSYVPNSSTMSGFGWNISTGVGNPYAYTQGNAPLIDLHMEETREAPYFYSPKVFGENFKLTRMKLLGSGQSAFDETDLPEADETILLVENGNVYLLETQEGYYVKVWIKSIDPPVIGHNYYTVHFDYKLQPIQGLRVL